MSWKPLRYMAIVCGPKWLLQRRQTIRLTASALVALGLERGQAPLLTTTGPLAEHLPADPVLPASPGHVARHFVRMLQNRQPSSRVPRQLPLSHRASTRGPDLDNLHQFQT